MLFETQSSISSFTMDPEVSIQLRDVGKCYKLFENTSDQIKQAILGQRVKLYREFWALKNLSIDLFRGETFGIVGKNGSGKSTLLQLIAGILTPTLGTIHRSGKIAALLELGTGFNPEFSGHDNIYLNASLLGLKRREVDRLYDSIVAFADIGDCLHQAVKTYSSGMLVRLAFGVATSCVPDILIIDEALAVGDEYFQKKCYGRIRELQDDGCTIIFVSHSQHNIINFCTHALLIDSGELLAYGQPKTIVSTYQQLLYASKQQQDKLKQELRLTRNALTTPGSAPLQADTVAVQPPGLAGDGGRDPSEVGEPVNSPWFDEVIAKHVGVEFESKGATISSVSIFDASNTIVNVLQKGCVYRLHYEVYFTSMLEGVFFSGMIKTAQGIHISGLKTAFNSHDEAALRYQAGDCAAVDLSFRCLLNQGMYSVNAAVFAELEGSEAFVARLVDATLFKVVDQTSVAAVGITDLFVHDAIR